LEKLFYYIPKVEVPRKVVSFREKLFWTLIVLIVYYILCQVTIYGLDPTASDYYKEMRAILAGNFASIITLGIGPIVMASIILQLLTGAKIIKFDLSTIEGRTYYQNVERLLAIIFTLIEASMLVISGQLPPRKEFIEALGFGKAASILVFQVFLGGLLIILLDDVVSKWGFGSGLSLFIAAGVSQEIMVGAFNPLPTEGGEPAGAIPAFLVSLSKGMPEFVRPGLAPDLLTVFATIIIFIICLYAQVMRVEIPLVYGRIGKFGRRFPVPLVYASNLPVIFAMALLMNFRIWATLLSTKGLNEITIFGHSITLWVIDAGGHVTGGLLYYLMPNTLFTEHLVQGILTKHEILNAIIFTIFMVITSIIFSVLWVEVSGMDAESLAKRLHEAGMQIPGFRRDERVTLRILKRYIPAVTILGGAFVGLLAAFATLTGAFGGGTGVLLLVGIIYNLYQEIASHQLMEMHPIIRKIVGERKIAF